MCTNYLFANKAVIFTVVD